MVKFERCVVYTISPYIVISLILLAYKFMDYGSPTHKEFEVNRHSVREILRANNTDDSPAQVRDTAIRDLARRKLRNSRRQKVSASEFLQRSLHSKTLDSHVLEERFNYEIKYENFAISEPNFISDEDRKAFRSLPLNLEYLGQQPPDKLKGIIQMIPYGIAHMDIDCGWPSKLEDFFSNINSSTIDILTPLLVPDSAAFQHFLDGTMPKLIQSYNIIKAPNVKLLIFRPRDNIIFDMLEKLNISQNKLVYYVDTTGAKLQINSCITPPLHPLLWRKSRQMLGGPERLPVPVNQSNVVLLTRAGSYNGGRNMLNFGAVKDYLQRRYASRLLIFEGDYSLNRSIQVFGKSIILIGVHGGAMYNLNFASSDCHIIEFLPMIEFGIPIERIAHTIIWHMSQLLGQTYWRIHQTADTFDGDINVPIDKLELVLNAADQKLARLSK